MKISAKNEELLVNSIKNDDYRAFESLYLKYVGIVLSAISKHVKSKTDAEDLTQETFLAIWEQRHHLNIQSSFFAYLYSVARYKTYKYIKTKKLTDEYEVLWEKLTDPYSQHLIDKPEAFITREMEMAEHKLHTMVELLPRQMKKVYQLNVEYKLNTAQIAEKLMISEYTVKKQLTIVKKRLRSAMLNFF